MATLNTDQILINVGYAPADSTGELRDIEPDGNYLYRSLMDVYCSTAALGWLILWPVRVFGSVERQARVDGKLFAFDEAMANLNSWKH